MNKLIIVFLTFISIHTSIAQTKDTVTVAEITQKVKSGKTDSLYFGFEANDEVIFSLATNGNKIKQVEVVEIRGGVIFKDYKIENDISKAFKINKRCVLGFYIENSSMRGKVYQLTIKRICISKSKNFNTNVVWRPVFDSTFTTSHEEYVEKTDTIFETVMDRTSRVHSLTSINFEPNRQVVDFYLPDNCIGWTYWIGVGSEGKAAYTEAKKNVMKSLAGAANLIPEYGPLISLALNGAIALNSTQPGDNIQYWFTDNKAEADKFLKKEDFKSFKQGNIVKDYGKINTPSKGYIYINLLNDNIREGIDVDIKILAIRISEKYGLKAVKKINKINYRGNEPFNAN